MSKNVLCRHRDHSWDLLHVRQVSPPLHGDRVANPTNLLPKVVVWKYEHAPQLQIWVVKNSTLGLLWLLSSPHQSQFLSASFHQSRIIGPQCVLSCLQDDVAIPKANHPIYNICLRGVEISCSSIEKHERVRKFSEGNMICTRVTSQMKKRWCL